MRKVRKVKYVTKEVPAEDYILPRENQQIVKMIRCRGNNLHEVREASGKTYLFQTAAKFRRTAWIRRGDFLMVEPTKQGSPVTAEIRRILFPYQIEYIRDQGVWPQTFGTEDDKHDNDSDDEDLFLYGNRPTVDDYDDITTENYSSSDSEEEEIVYKNAK